MLCFLFRKILAVSLESGLLWGGALIIVVVVFKRSSVESIY